MDWKKYDWIEILVVIIVTIGVLIMTACLYLDILLMQRMVEIRADIEAAVRSIETTIDVPEVVEDVVEAAPEVTYFNVPLDEDLQDHIFAECEKYGVEPAMIVAMIERESRFKIDIVGDSGKSFGLMQIQKKWHSDRMEKLGCTDLLNPYQNVTVGIDYLAEMIGYGKGVEWALMAYNGGPSYANKKAAAGEVSAYASEILHKVSCMHISEHGGFNI